MRDEDRQQGRVAGAPDEARPHDDGLQPGAVGLDHGGLGLRLGGRSRARASRARAGSARRRRRAAGRASARPRCRRGRAAARRRARQAAMTALVPSTLTRRNSFQGPKSPSRAAEWKATSAPRAPRSSAPASTQVAAHGLRPGLAHLRLGLRRAGERADGPAVRGEAADQGGSDEAGPAGDERGRHGRPRYCGRMSAIPEPAQRLAPAGALGVAALVGGCVPRRAAGCSPLLRGDAARRRGRRSAWRCSAVALVAGTAVVPELRWRRWRWEVREHEIDLQRGILVVRRTLIPMARVQHVETERGVIGQLLGLSTVEIHTAAGSHEIPLLRDDDAGAIRARIAELARTETMGERLHPAAIAVYAADALRQGAVPLLVLLGISVFGGGFDAEAALRGAMFAAAGTARRGARGRRSAGRPRATRWRTRRPAARRARCRSRRSRSRSRACRPSTSSRARPSGCSASTASTSRRAAAARAARSCSSARRRGGGRAHPRAARAAGARPTTRPRRPSAGCPGASSRVAAATSGQLGVLVPVAAGVAQMSQQLFEDPLEGERTIVGALPDGALGWVLLAAGRDRARVAAGRARHRRRLRRLRRAPRGRRAADPPRPAPAPPGHAARGARARRAGGREPAAAGARAGRRCASR